MKNIIIKFRYLLASLIAPSFKYNELGKRLYEIHKVGWLGNRETTKKEIDLVAHWAMYHFMTTKLPNEKEMFNEAAKYAKLKDSFYPKIADHEAFEHCYKYITQKLRDTK